MILDEIPVIWIEKIVKSIDGDEWYKHNDNCGYTVYPVFGKNKSFNNINDKNGGSNQNLILFIRGNFQILQL